LTFRLWLGYQALREKSDACERTPFQLSTSSSSTASPFYFSRFALLNLEPGFPLRRLSQKRLYRLGDSSRPTGRLLLPYALRDTVSLIVLREGSVGRFETLRTRPSVSDGTVVMLTLALRESRVTSDGKPWSQSSSFAMLTAFFYSALSQQPLAFSPQQPFPGVWPYSADPGEPPKLRNGRQSSLFAILTRFHSSLRVSRFNPAKFPISSATPVHFPEPEPRPLCDEPGGFRGHPKSCL
jgi:hypothetical protein